jgi:hypothetical protein
MGAGRAAGFDAEVTDFGSVSGRPSGPVESAQIAPQQQQMNSITTNTR